MHRPIRLQPLNLLLVLLVALGWTSTGVAQEVTVRVGTREAFVDEPFRIVVSVETARDFDGPFFDETPGLEITRSGGEQTSTSITTVNGRTVQRRTVAMNFEGIARSPGSYTIPAFRITTPDGDASSKPVPITVRPAGRNDMLAVRVTGEPRVLYSGQKGTMRLELRVKRYTDQALGLTLDEASMWSLIDTRASDWGIFTPALQQLAAENRRPRGDLQIVDGTECYVFTIAREFEPISTGTPEIGDVRVRMEYPTSLQRSRDFFGGNRLAVGASRTLSVVPSEIDLEVVATPEGGRPKAWNGAVGNFELLAVAQPTDVAVGDPITLTVRITDRSGTAALDGLQAPDLAAQAPFRTGFRVQTDLAAGTVEGRSKIFAISIRALDDSITAIPSIEFPYFDPARGIYDVARSEPLPITVKPSSIVRIDLPDSEGSNAAPTGELTAIEGGLLANMGPSDARSRSTATLPLLALATGIPLALLIVPAGLRTLRARRSPAERRWASAWTEFERRTGEDADAASLESALLDLTAARIGRSAGGFSRGDAADALLGLGVDQAIRERLDRALRECERARYLGATVDRPSIVAVAREVVQATEAVGRPGKEAA